MLPSLSPAQRDELAINGTPVPIVDDVSGQAYLLLAVQVDHKPGEYTAHLPGIPLYAEGATEEEAVVCLAGAMSAYLAVPETDWKS